MTVDNNGKRVNNKLFGWLKRHKAYAHRQLMIGKPKTEEAKAKMSAAKQTPEAKARIADSNRSRVVSEETRRKMSQSAKLRRATRGMTGMKHSEATREKMRAARKAYVESNQQETT
jgi:hypothetical protein